MPQKTVFHRMDLRLVERAKAMPSRRKKPNSPLSRSMNGPLESEIVENLLGRTWLPDSVSLRLLPHMIPDIRKDRFRGRAGQKYLRNPACLQSWDVLFGNDAARQHQHIVEFLLFQKLHHAR